MTAAGAAAALSLVVVAACGDEPPGVAGPARCTAPAQPAVAVACAMVYGTVVNALGEPMTGIEGIGAAPVPVETRLQIPLPLSGS